MTVTFSLIETHLIEGPRNEMIKPESPEIEAENRRMISPGFCVLFRHEELGTVLYDTGISNRWEQSWNETMKRLYRLEANSDIAQKLGEFGLTAHDIDLLILSHMHYDHAGNVALFQGTKAGRNILISEAEAREAFVQVNLDDTGYSGAYLKREFLNLEGIGYRLLKEDAVLAPGVELFIQRGHTPGVIGLMLTTKNNGCFIFPSDAAYSSRNVGPPIVLPGICNAPEEYVENIRKLHRRQREHNATIVYSHDHNTLRKSPYFYD